MNYSQILKNALFNILALLVSMITSFFLYPFLIHHLGEARYGAWALLGSVTGYMGLLDFGFGIAITKYVAEYKKRGDQGLLRGTIRTGTLLYGFSSAGAAVIGAGIYFIFPYMFRLNPDLVAEARLALLAVGVDLIFTFWFVAVRSALEGLQRYDLSNLANILSTLLRAGLIVILVLKGFGLFYLALVTLVVNRLSDVIILFSLWREIVLPEPVPMKKVPVSQILTYSVYAFMEMIALRVFYYTDNLVIAVMIGAEGITHYSMAFMLIEAVRNLTHRSMGVLMPVVSEISVEEEDVSLPKLRALFESGSRVSASFSLPVLLALIVTGKSLMAAWLGSGFDDGYWCLVVIAVPQIWILSQSVGIRIIYGLAMHKNYAYYSSVVSLLNLGLSIALARPLGILGVALGTSIPSFLGRVYMNDYFRRLLKMELLPYYISVWRRLFGLGIIAGAGLIAAFRLLEPKTLLMHAVIYGAYYVLFEAAAYFLVLKPRERAQIENLLLKRIKGENNA